MNIRVNMSVFQSSISIINSVINGSDIYFTISKEDCYCFYKDNLNFIRIKINDSIEDVDNISKKEVQFCIDGKYFIFLMNNYKKKEYFDLKISSNIVVSFEEDTYTFAMKSISGSIVDNFNEYTSKEIISNIEFCRKQLISTLKNSISFSSNENTRFTLRSVYIHDEDNLTSFVSTDGKSLYKKKIETNSSINDNVMLSPESCQILIKLTELINSDKINLNFYKNYIIANVENASLIINKINGRFPPYSKVIPKVLEDGWNSFEVRVDEIKECLKRVRLFLDESCYCCLAFKKDTIIFSASDENNSEAKVHCSIKKSDIPNDFCIKFNPSLVERVINSVPKAKENVKLYLLNESEKIVYFSYDDKMISMAMPVKV